MSTYEITLVYPDRPYEAHRPFLTEAGRSRSSGLVAARPHQAGLALTIRVETDRGLGVATELARQRAAGFWPSYQPAEAS
ncbi:MAG TPA: hypothetical protein VHB02_03800 [Acidimicrobiales bacterium]|nr:hypothetical protein [Acidimicrobiales bacterium]